MSGEARWNLKWGVGFLELIDCAVWLLMGTVCLGVFWGGVTIVRGGAHMD